MFAAPLRNVERRIFVSLFFIAVTLLLLAQSLTKPLDHDEHQFVASGWLMARQGLLPYRDFPYFHLPYLSLLYALVYRFTDQLLLGARLISVTAALLGMLSVFSVLQRGAPNAQAIFIATAALLIWLLNPLTQYASGLAWNHDAALLFCLLAFALFARHAPTTRDYFLSGICLAIAIGMRATFVLATLPLVMSACFTSARKTALGGWVAGLALGLLPILVFFLLAPAQFIFGNLTYAALNTEWRLMHEYERAMTLTDKFAYLLTDVIGWSSTLLVILAFVVALVIGIRQRLSRPFWLAATLSLAMFVAALVPTPTFEQYYYSALPFVIVSIALACRAQPSRVGVALMLVLLIMSLPQGFSVMRNVPLVFMPDQWTSSKTHQVGAWLRERAGSGTIVTLAPIYPLEAGLPIDAQLATGPFAYRVGTLMSADERAQQGLFTIEDIGKHLDARAPHDMLLGYEPEELEEPLVDYARAHQFKYVRLPNGKNLWLAP